MDRPRGASLLERDAELASLDGMLASARDGVGAVAVVQGPPGIGKTALLECARDSARTAGMAVRQARAGVLEQDHPFGVARQLLGATVDARPRTGSTSVGEMLFDTLERLFAEFAGLAHAHPLLVCVDDAHWADVESLRLCAYLAARIESLAALLVLAMRPEEAGPQREVLGVIAGAGRILTPAPLTAGAVAAFVSDGLEAEAEDGFAAACVAATGGNPYLLGELVVTARSQRIEPVVSSAAQVAGLTPAGVQHAVLVRLARLAPDTRKLASAVAVLGGNAPLGQAAALAGLEPVAAAAAADELTRASVLAPSEDLEFLHPLIRNAVYADLRRPQREAAHAAAARLLDQTMPGDVDRVAAHLLAIAPAGDRWSAARLGVAGHRALDRGACDAAVAYLTRALAEPPPPEARADMLVALAQAEAATGSPGGIDHLEQALPLITEPVRRAEVRRSLGRLFFFRGQFTLAGQAAKAALDELGEATDTPLGRSLLADYLAAATFELELRAGEDARAVELVTEALNGKLPVEPQLLAYVAGAMALSGATPHQVGSVLRAAIAAGPPEDETSQGFAAAMLASACLAVEDYDLATEVVGVAAERAARTGSVVAEAQANQVTANICLHRGHLAEAVSHAEAAIQLRHAGWDILVPQTAVTLALAEIERGRLDAAAAAIAIGGEVAAGPIRPYLLYARGRLRLAEGAPADALEDLQSAGSMHRGMFGVEHPTFLPWRPAAALAALAVGDRELATKHAERGLALARPLSLARPLGIALCVAGQVHGGRHGIGLLREAVAVLAGSQSQLEHAEALVALGSALRRAGRPTDAREPLGHGLQVARNCGATPLAARAHDELVATGLRPRKTIRAGPDALTPAEQRVARMAADGLTNRQIAATLVLSTRTIETHLARAYLKLGVKSRHTLAQALAETSQG